MTQAQARASAGHATRRTLRVEDEPELFTPPPKPPLRKLEKAPHAFRTISEVGEELNVPQHVLRFWETKFTQLRPLKRGGGRRYYRAEDVALIRQIHTLLYGEGYTIKGAQKVLKDQTGKPAGENNPGTSVTEEARPVDVAQDSVPETDRADLSDPTAGTDEARALLREMLAELKELRALV